MAGLEEFSSLSILVKISPAFLRFIGISISQFTFNGKKFECRPVFNVNNTFKNVAFTKNFFTKQPKLLIRCSTFNDSDPVNTRVNISVKQPFTFNVILQEDTSKDAETVHKNENVNFVAIE